MGCDFTTSEFDTPDEVCSFIFLCSCGIFIAFHRIEIDNAYSILFLPFGRRPIVLSQRSRMNSVKNHSRLTALSSMQKDQPFQKRMDTSTPTLCYRAMNATLPHCWYVFLTHPLRHQSTTATVRTSHGFMDGPGTSFLHDLGHSGRGMPVMRIFTCSCPH